MATGSPRMEPTPRKPEIWGGVECTVNRVGDVWFDQLDKSGHARRPGDIALFAGLGLRAIRYPVLWERTAPHENAPPHWGWADERLGLIRDAGIEPIVGLLHHGSGPRHTSLVDPRFPEKLAAYALAVAERYPWVDRYTPVNEPLTTARFSGLSGLWYPHGRDDRTFATTLVNQCRGVAMAMRAMILVSRPTYPHSGRRRAPAANMVAGAGKVTLSMSNLAYALVISWPRPSTD